MIIITVHCGRQTKHVNITYEDNAELFRVKAKAAFNKKKALLPANWT